MSLHREHKKSQPPWLDLAVFAGVLAFLGYSVQAFLGGRTGVTPSVGAPPPENAAATSAPSPDRSPASQATQPGSSASTEILRVPCLHEGAQVYTSTARLIQIHSIFCAGDDKTPGGSWTASNQSNGEEILVFVNRREKTLSTSYFSLQEGRNELVFVEELGRGKQRREKILVNRKAD